jgi:hypothetical protein
MDTTMHAAATAEPVGPPVDRSRAASAPFLPATRIDADMPGLEDRAAGQAVDGTFGWKPRVKRFAIGVAKIGLWIVTAIVTEVRIRRDTRQLMAMGDHMLKDIGITRADIGDAVRSGRDGR